MSKPVRYLKRTYILMRKALDERLSAYHLTTSQFEILGYLYATPPVEQQQLQHYSGVTSATLTGILDKLEQRGYLIRTFSSADGRAKVVSLTPLGNDLFAELIDLFHDFEQAMLKGFSLSERALLTDWLQRIAFNLGDRDS
ncbi:MAG: MarR family transcriptional regulator, partial [Herpetosiphonaceae bacterium]|nr:MarR family transcriptional regulator [Herpetosiphonaceae bacterium]